MVDWGKYPFVRILIPLALGIWCANFFASFSLTPVALVVVMLTLLVFAVVTSATVKTIRLGWLFGVFMFCCLLVSGYALTHVRRASFQKDYFRNYEVGTQYYVARVCDYPTEREKTIRSILELEYQLCDSLPSRPVSGKVMAYFQKTDSAFALRYGDVIAIPAPVKEVPGPKNPKEFDYRAYLMRKGITGQTYLRDSDWMNLQMNKANPVYAFSYRFRDILLASLRQSGLNGDEFGVAAALLLGYDEYLADEVRQRYVAAGAMHILCVSGLHVGIIYLMASALLGFLDRRKWQKTLKQVLLLAFIWFYALIAGLSPSILRASMMISFVIIGQMIQRKGFVINSIAASAFVLLCINPYNLFEIGFQLSYAAVVGIVVLQRPIYNLLYIKNRLLDKVWQITTVALAAQMATIPFTLFYFNQITLYFWLSNLVMTPLSFIAIFSGMALFFVSWIPVLNVWVGHLVWGTVYVMNAFVSWVEQLPWSIIKGLYVNGFEFAMLLLSLLMLMIAVATQRRRWLIGMLSLLLLFTVSQTYRGLAVNKQRDLVFYSLRKHTAIDFIVGNRHVLLADSILMSDKSAVDYSLKGAWALKRLSMHPQVIGFDEDYEDATLLKRQNLVSFNGKLLALWDGSRLKDSLSYRLPVDYLLVRDKQKPDLRSIVNGYDLQMLLIDGSVPDYLAERWATQAREMELPYIKIGDGAVEIEE